MQNVNTKIYLTKVYSSKIQILWGKNRMGGSHEELNPGHLAWAVELRQLDNHQFSQFSVQVVLNASTQSFTVTL